MKIGLWKSRAPRPNSYRPIEGLSYMAHKYSIGFSSKSRHGHLPSILSTMPPTLTSPKPDSPESYHVEPDVEDTDGATSTIYTLGLPFERAIEVIGLIRDKGARSNLTFGTEGWAYVELARAMGRERLALYLEDDN
ncbi:hypothetical protein CDV36_016308 [Fusarium kuroshium]|uniref:Uncharacterized protein n=1 Tax=Fusarium kuroshium TaxID=2010991 RepID=A0A3M2QUC6_9HYPO|nr:hypothetical protein CDV36_016308 [Fusarium kuroshium]